MGEGFDFRRGCIVYPPESRATVPRTYAKPLLTLQNYPHPSKSNDKPSLTTKGLDEHPTEC